MNAANFSAMTPARRSTTEKVLLSLCAAVVPMLLAAFSVVRLFRNTSPAMEPTLPAGAHLITTPARALARKEIVTFRYPRNPKELFVKRVVAVAGDTIEIRQKRLFVNGAEIAEPYVVHTDSNIYPVDPYLPDARRFRDQLAPYRVPAGQLFVLGDHRDQSSDSRYWGPVPEQSVIGKVRMAFTWRRGFWRPV